MTSSCDVDSREGA